MSDYENTLTVGEMFAHGLTRKLWHTDDITLLRDGIREWDALTAAVEGWYAVDADPDASQVEWAEAYQRIVTAAEALMFRGERDELASTSAGGDL